MKGYTLLASALMFAAALLVLGSARSSSAPAPADPPVPSKLVKARLDAAQEAFRKVDEGRNTGPWEAEKQYIWSKRLLEAQREAAASKEEVAAAFRAHRDRMVTLETETTDATRFRIAGSGPQVVAAAAFYRAEAELWLARAEPRR